MPTSALDPRIAQPETMPADDSPAWDELRALDLSRLTEFDMESLLSHPRLEAVFGLPNGVMRWIDRQMPEVGFRHLELTPSLPLDPKHVKFALETSYPRLERLALGNIPSAESLLWLLTTPVGRRLTHLAFRLEEIELEHVLSILSEHGTHLREVAFAKAPRRQTLVGWQRLVRDNSAFRSCEVADDAGANRPVFGLLPFVDGDGVPAFHPRAAARSGSLPRPTSEDQEIPAERPGAPALDERVFWAMLDEARAHADTFVAAPEELAEFIRECIVARANPTHDIPMYTWRVYAWNEAFLTSLGEQLDALDTSAILAFSDRQEILAARAQTLELRCAHLVATGYWSDDGFLYFVHGLLARGRGAYEMVIANPDTLAEVNPRDTGSPHEALDVGFETLMYAAAKAYKGRTGEWVPNLPTKKQRPIGNFARPSRSDDAWRARFPRLWARFRSSTPPVEPSA